MENLDILDYSRGSELDKSLLFRCQKGIYFFKQENSLNGWLEDILIVAFMKLSILKK